MCLLRAIVAAAVLGGIDNIWIAPGMKVLYLGAAAGTTVSHVSDIVGPTGAVYAVEFSHRPGRDLLTVAKQRTNIIPIIDDARHPLKYRMLLGMVDTIFADVAQPDQARIVALNAHYFLKNGGHFGQGLLHRQHRGPRSRLSTRSGQAASRKFQALGTAHAGTLRARSRYRHCRVPPQKEKAVGIVLEIARESCLYDNNCLGPCILVDLNL